MNISFEKYDIKKNTYNNRHGVNWSLEEDLMLTVRWLDLKLSIHDIAKLHKRSYKSIYLRLKLNNLITEKLTKEHILKNNAEYLKGGKYYVY